MPDEPCIKWEEPKKGRRIGDKFIYISTNGKKFDTLSLPPDFKWFQDAAIGVPEAAAVRLFDKTEFIQLTNKIKMRHVMVSVIIHLLIYSTLLRVNPTGLGILSRQRLRNRMKNILKN